MVKGWKTKKVVILAGIFLGLIHIGIALAAEDPLKMLQTVTGRVILKLKENKQKFRNTDRDRMDKIYLFVKAQILPFLDFEEMGRWIVGRNAWREADNIIRRTFINEFKTFMVRNYTDLFLKWTNEEIEFFPLRDDVKNQKDIQVSSLIKRPGRSSIQVDYQLILLKDGWKVYDILIEGISILESYQEQFASDVRKGGLEAVIEEMRRLNDS